MISRAFFILETQGDEPALKKISIKSGFYLETFQTHATFVLSSPLPLVVIDL